MVGGGERRPEFRFGGRHLPPVDQDFRQPGLGGEQGPPAGGNPRLVPGQCREHRNPLTHRRLRLREAADVEQRHPQGGENLRTGRAQVGPFAERPDQPVRFGQGGSGGRLGLPERPALIEHLGLVQQGPHQGGPGRQVVGEFGRQHPGGRHPPPGRLGRLGVPALPFQAPGQPLVAFGHPHPVDRDRRAVVGQAQGMPDRLLADGLGLGRLLQGDEEVGPQP